MEVRGDPVLKLTAGNYALVLSAERGGSILDFTWRGEPLLRPTAGRSILDVASFPLVPFSNRIAEGRFAWGGREHRIAPNMPESNHPHPLHGFGWLAKWETVEAECSRALLEHRYPGGEWPWPYRAAQEFRLSAAGLAIELSLTNLGDGPMPAGIGFHPFFPRTPLTRYSGLHRGQWRNTPDCLPQSIDLRDYPRDWWDGAPVGDRAVDTVYTGRAGPLTIAWPERGLGIEIGCSPSLPYTAVYTPEGADWFCVEPVSHMTDAVNRGPEETGLVSLSPHGTLSATLTIRGYGRGEGRCLSPA